MSKRPKRQRGPGNEADRTVDIAAANPPTSLKACLGKSRFASEERALVSARGKGTAYRCLWCEGWHLTLRGYKGQRRR
jgi:hypothetical protein